MNTPIAHMHTHAHAHARVILRSVPSDSGRLAAAVFAISAAAASATCSSLPPSLPASHFFPASTSTVSLPCAACHLTDTGQVTLGIESGFMAFIKSIFLGIPRGPKSTY